MKDVTSEGRTVLFVSHNMGVIQSLCDRAVYLKNGEVQYIGKTNETISNYMNSGQEIIINNRTEEKPVFLKIFGFPTRKNLQTLKTSLTLMKTYN